MYLNYLSLSHQDHNFIQRYQVLEVDVAGWFQTVMDRTESPRSSQCYSHQHQLHSLFSRQPSLPQPGVSLARRQSSLALALPSPDSVCPSLAQRQQLSIALEPARLFICPPERLKSPQRRRRDSNGGLWMNRWTERWTDGWMDDTGGSVYLDRQMSGGGKRKKCTLQLASFIQTHVLSLYHVTSPCVTPTHTLHTNCLCILYVSLHFLHFPLVFHLHVCLRH